MKRLDEKLIFPKYEETDKSGIIAYGGDLSLERLKLAYRKGIFPWFNENEPILWWFPNPRFVLFPNELKVSKSMQKIIKNQVFSFTENKAFEKVIENCRKISRAGQTGSWITDEMTEAYIGLHKSGQAKSVEVWQAGELVGGFYGVESENVFCGESMFAKVSNASKAGFIYFVQKYKNQYELIDCQVYTNHLSSLGAREISADAFIGFLNS
ncbi:MAG TPA: leucyl/phenylalanyl-tRNA--protein transferase [Moheibacter sp.]|nr:leucyl/phenylalanyl-tRNA--protein transferase [Moheibacter sp.]